MTLFGMNRFLLSILSLSLSGALVGMLILLIHPLTGKLFSRKWNYYVWFLVIIRLLVPMQFTAALPGGIAFNLNPAQEQTAAKVSAQETTERASAQTADGATTQEKAEIATGEASEGAVEKAAPDSVERTFPQAELTETSEPAVSLTSLLLLAAEIIWILGAVAALCLKLWNYRQYIAFIKKDAHPVTDSRIMIPAQSVAARLHMRKVPPVYESASVSGPVTIGLWRPMIVLPEARQNLQNSFMQYQMILHHELVHVARWDLWYKWLYQLLLCIHWFNPFLYLVERKMNMDCELSCDEAVLAELTEDGRKAYGNVLLDIAEQNAVSMKSAFTTTFVTGESELKKRLTGILHYKRTTVPRLLLSLCVMAGTLFLTACGGVYLSQDDSWEETFDSDFWYDDSAEEGNGIFWNTFMDIGRVDKDGEAYRVYDDTALLAGEDLSDKWQAYNYRGGGNKVEMSGFALNGSYSLRIVYAAEDTDIEVTSFFDLKEGKFKLVHIAPDGTVTTLNDTGEKSTVTVTMPKGRNVIKIAGQAASLKDAEITFSGLKGKSYENIYYSEEDEYAGQIRNEIQNDTVEKDKVMESLYYMEDEDISEAFAALLKQGTVFDEDELTNIFIYSDAERSGDYLVDAINNGLVGPLSVDSLSRIIVYLEGKAKVELINALPAEDFFEGLMECRPFLSEEELEECLLAYIDAGGRLSYAQFDDIEVFLNRSTIEKMDERMALPAEAGEP
ncbi:MAG: M56 family metallopeptidase [Lachnospiraceae bacterium]|nr:M56 family metallopeptidase [Lachnospiraceae bacterium]